MQHLRRAPLSAVPGGPSARQAAVLHRSAFVQSTACKLQRDIILSVVHSATMRYCPLSQRQTITMLLAPDAFSTLQSMLGFGEPDVKSDAWWHSCQQRLQRRQCNRLLPVRLRGLCRQRPPRTGIHQCGPAVQHLQLCPVNILLRRTGAGLLLPLHADEDICKSPPAPTIIPCLLIEVAANKFCHWFAWLQ